MTAFAMLGILLLGAAIGWWMRAGSTVPKVDETYAAKTVMLDVMGKPELFVVTAASKSTDGTTVELLDLAHYLQRNRR